jgi:hypothetical protein
MAGFNLLLETTDYVDKPLTNTQTPGRSIVFSTQGNHSKDEKTIKYPLRIALALGVAALASPASFLIEKMRHNTLAAACLALAAISFASPSIAACPSKTIFSCTTTKGKAVEVCDSSKTVDYSFGKKGQKPEMALSVPRNAASTKQWEGIGRNMYYSVLIPNGKTTYEVFSSSDKSGEESAYGIYVLVGGKEVATINCKPTTVTDNIEGVTLRRAPE